MKFTSYKQLKNASREELETLNIDDYSDDELKQVETWLTEAELETLFESQDFISGLSVMEKKWLRLNDEVISESAENITVDLDGKSISGKIAVSYPEFYIVKEDSTGRYFKVDNI